VACQDRLVWKAEQNGEYTVKSGYRLLTQEKETWHVLFDCEGTKNCWMAAGLQTVIAARLQEYDNARDVIFYICHRESKEIAGSSK
jgi:hypothetical protein